MKRTTLKLIIAGSLGAIACGSSVTNTATSSTPTPKPAATAAAEPVDELAGGRALYEQNCAACHKEDGTGGKMTIEGETLNVDDLTSDKIRKFTDEKITGYIYNGVEDEGMPAFKDKLAEAQIREIVGYVRKGLQKETRDNVLPLR